MGEKMALRESVLSIPTREELMGGQRYKYVRLEEVLGAIDFHLTQPAQACEHDWAEGYGVPAYCKHCGVARVAQPAQAVDVLPVRITKAPYYWEVGGGAKVDSATGYCNGWNDCLATCAESLNAAAHNQQEKP